MVRLAGFSGSRSLASAGVPLVRSVLAGVVGAGWPVAVGCCSGVDAAVRSGCGSLGVSPRVFSAAAAPFAGLPRRSALAARSVAFVQCLAAERGVLLSFPACACPAGVVPARSWRSGVVPSGSWSSLALAVGLGVRVAVFPLSAFALPVWPGGSWVRRSVFGVVGFVWAPSGAHEPVDLNNILSLSSSLFHEVQL